MTAKYLRSPSAAVVTEARGKEETIQEQIDDLKKQLASLKRENDKKFGLRISRATASQPKASSSNNRRRPVPSTGHIITTPPTSTTSTGVSPSWETTGCPEFEPTLSSTQGWGSDKEEKDVTERLALRMRDYAHITELRHRNPRYAPRGDDCMYAMDERGPYVYRNGRCTRLSRRQEAAAKLPSFMRPTEASERRHQAHFETGLYTAQLDKRRTRRADARYAAGCKIALAKQEELKAEFREHLAWKRRDDPEFDPDADLPDEYVLWDEYVHFVQTRRQEEMERADDAFGLDHSSFEAVHEPDAADSSLPCEVSVDMTGGDLEREEQPVLTPQAPSSDPYAVENISWYIDHLPGHWPYHSFLHIDSSTARDLLCKALDLASMAFLDLIESDRADSDIFLLRARRCCKRDWVSVNWGRKEINRMMHGDEEYGDVFVYGAGWGDLYDLVTPRNQAAHKNGEVLGNAEGLDGMLETVQHVIHGTIKDEKRTLEVRELRIRLRTMAVHALDGFDGPRDILLALPFCESEPWLLLEHERMFHHVLRTGIENRNLLVKESKDPRFQAFMRAAEEFERRGHVE